MQKKPLVSVITISFNSEKTIRRTIKSVLSQSYKNIEYIIIDGGSSDRTCSIIAEYESQIAYWKSEPDRGISDAFNNGIAAAKGDLIGIVNSDDWYEPDAVENIVDCYLTKPSDVIFGDIFFPELNRRQHGNPDFHYKIKYTMPCMNHPSCFVHSTAYKKVGLFDINYKIAMDYQLLKRFYNEGLKFTYLPKIITNMSLAGASNQNLVRRYWEVFKVAKKHPLSVIYILENLAHVTVRRLMAKKWI